MFSLGGKPIGQRESAVGQTSLEETGCVKAPSEDLEPTSSELVMLGNIRPRVNDELQGLRKLHSLGAAA